MPKKILMPKLNSNDEVITLVDWNFSNRDYIKKGDIICLLETSKSIFEFAAEESGYLHAVVCENDTIMENEILCFLLETPDELLSEPNQPSGATDLPLASEEKYPRATQKAIAFARKSGVDLADIEGRGIIKEKDVLAFIEKQRSHQQDKAPWRRVASLKEISIKVSSEKLIDKEFLKSLLEDYEEGGEFGNLPSNKKIEILKNKGALIGEGVKIEKGGYVISQYIEIGDKTTIGKDSVFRAKALKIGKKCRFGNKISAASNIIEIGDMLFSDNEIKIGAGGEWGRDSILKMGNGCVIGDCCMINTSRPVIIEDEVCLAYGSKIFTHSFWLSALEGYPALFSPVRIGKGTILGVHATVMPGVEIGGGAIILTNSLVLSNVPQGSMAAGIPASIIKPEGHYPLEISNKEKDRIILDAFRTLADDLDFRNHDVKIEETKDSTRLSWKNETTVYIYSKQLTRRRQDKTTSFKRKIFLTFLYDEFELKNNETVFDLTRKKIFGQQDRFSDEIREILRKRGIRCTPSLWRYNRRPQWLDLPFNTELMK